MTQFAIPTKYANPVCGECHDTTEDTYHQCQNPCSHLVSWASHQAASVVIAEARRSAVAIRRHNEEDTGLSRATELSLGSKG